MNIIEAPRDLKGLETYIPKFIELAAQAESGPAARRRAMRLAAAVNPERIAAMQQDSQGIPYAFELWIGHLGWLDQMSAGVQFTPDDLRPEEAQGLALLRRARETFARDHSRCPMCNAVTLKSAAFCGGCGAEFK